MCVYLDQFTVNPECSPNIPGPKLYPPDGTSQVQGDMCIEALLCGLYIRKMKTIPPDVPMLFACPHSHNEKETEQCENATPTTMFRVTPCHIDFCVCVYLDLLTVNLSTESSPEIPGPILHPLDGTSQAQGATICKTEFLNKAMLYKSLCAICCDEDWLGADVHIGHHNEKDSKVKTDSV